MAGSVALSDLQEHLGDVLARVENGEEIVVEKGGSPVFRLVPEHTAGPNPEPRVFGGNLLGVTYVAPDCFDPMTDEELAEWGI